MLFETLMTGGPQLFLVIIISVVYALTVHEFSHAWAASYLGDNTSKYSGRLSLNPMVHLDVWGTLMLLFAGFGWGKPVPVNPHNLKWRKWGEAFVSLAGPLSNFISVILFIFVFKIILPYVDANSLLILFINYLIIVNMILGVFNLIPIPPLDGSKILFAALPQKYDHIKRWLSINGMLVLIGLLLLDRFSGIDIFSGIFSFFFGLIFKFI